MLKTARSITLVTAVLGLALAALACNLPGSQTPPPEEPTPLPATPTTQSQQPSQTPMPLPSETPPPDVVFEGTSFSYDDSLARGVKVVQVPASQYSDAPSWDINPEYLEIELDGYILPDHFHKPAVRVFPVEEYRQISPAAGETITALKSFLSQCQQSPEDIPFLPLWNAAQMLQVKVSCLDFKNGRGVRFVSQYGQAANPINNDDLFYTFQGLTTDEGHYLSVVLPLSHPDLPPNGDNPPGGDWAAFSDRFAEYIAEMEQQLDQYPDESFYPALNLLDDLIRTIEIKPGV